MIEALLPCPACGVKIRAAAKRCTSCGRGIATVTLRAWVQGEKRRWTRRIACDAEEVEFMDGLEAEIDNPEEIPGRES